MNLILSVLKLLNIKTSFDNIKTSFDNIKTSFDII